MSEHTKGPWEAGFIVDQGWSILGPNRELIAVLGEDSIESGDPIEEDARRIVACVNACAGFKTEALERHGIDGVMFGTKEWLMRLEDQRDALLAALESLVLFTNPKPSNAVALNNAHQAITAAKGSGIMRTNAGAAHGPDITLPDGTGVDVAKAAGHLPKPELYTSISKGGSYTKLGAIRGAGSLKGLAGIAYQNEKGDLFIREPECFAKRMVLVTLVPKA